MNWLNWAYWGVALLASALYGCFAVRALASHLQDVEKTNAPFRWHQRWFNFVGSLSGWTALWALDPFSWPEAKPTFSWSTSLLVVAAFAGITGQLPWAFQTTVSAVVKPLGDLFERVAKVAVK